MRLRFVLVAALVLVAAPVGAQEQVDQLLTCSTTFSLRAQDLRGEGDEGGAFEAQNMSEALTAQAQAAMAAAGMDAAAIQNRADNMTMISGFRYGAGEKDAMIAECLAAWDSP